VKPLGESEYKGAHHPSRPYAGSSEADANVEVGLPEDAWKFSELDERLEAHGVGCKWSKHVGCKYTIE